MRLADDDELQMYIEIKDDEPATPEERFLKIVCTELARLVPTRPCRTIH